MLKFFKSFHKVASLVSWNIDRFLSKNCFAANSPCPVRKWTISGVGSWSSSFHRCDFIKELSISTKLVILSATRNKKRSSRSASGITLTAASLRITSVYRLSMSIQLFLVEEHRNHLFIAPHSVRPHYPLPTGAACIARKWSTVGENVDSIWHESSLLPRVDSRVFLRIYLGEPLRGWVFACTWKYADETLMHFATFSRGFSLLRLVVSNPFSWMRYAYHALSWESPYARFRKWFRGDVWASQMTSLRSMRELFNF